MTDTSELEKLFSYREEVQSELQVRLDRLRSIEQKLELQERKIAAVSQAGISGAQGILAQEAYRRRVSREREQLRKEKKEASDDVTRAQERLQQVEEELHHLERNLEEQKLEK